MMRNKIIGQSQNPVFILFLIIFSNTPVFTTGESETVPRGVSVTPIQTSSMTLFDDEVVADVVKLDKIVSNDTIAKMEINELVQHYGYTVEEHQFYASDGYLSTLHRISRANISSSERGFPCLIQHGFFQTGLSFLHNEEKSLPFLLVDNGFDVFLLNTRGSSTSLGHDKLKVTQKTYWRFGIDDVINIEVPQIIDYILEVAKSPKLNYVGHSLGTMFMLLTLANKPEYNEKIQRMSLIAPAGYLNNAQSPLFHILGEMSPEGLQRTMEGGFTNTMMRKTIRENLVTPDCKVAMGHTLCFSIYLLQLGRGYRHMNFTLVARSINHVSTMSPLILTHVLQMVKSGKIRKFDYGEKTNLIKYGQDTPPIYDLTTIRTPTQAFVSTEDVVTTVEDTLKTMKEIGYNFVNPDTAVLSNTSFTHMDYLINEKAYGLVYRHILEFLKTGKPVAPEEAIVLTPIENI